MNLRQKIASNKKRLKTYMSKRPHRSFRVSSPKRGAAKPKPLQSTWSLTKDTLKLVYIEKKRLASLALIYILAVYFLVGNNITQQDFTDLRDVAVQMFGGSVNDIGTTFAVALSMVDGVLGQDADATQRLTFAIITFVFALAIIWLIRMRLAGNKVGVRDALYNCGTPIIPSIVVFATIALQLTPGALALYIYSVASSGGYLQGGVEVMVFAVIVALFVALSVYWVCGSLTAMIIVTLPGMRPWESLCTASALVIGRRLAILVRLTALGVLLYLIWIAVLLLAVLIDGWLKFDWLPLLPFTAQALTAFMLVYVTAYIYKLYRGLL